MFVTQAVVRIIIGPFDRRFFDGERFILKANTSKTYSKFCHSVISIRARGAAIDRVGSIIIASP